MKWIRINGKDDLRDKFLSEIDWPHSFIREISVVSPSYILPDCSTTAPGYAPCVRVFVSSASVVISGVEILFLDAEGFSVFFDEDLEPEATISDSAVEWKFSKSVTTPITSKSVYYRYLDADTWGKELRYGWEDVFDSGGELCILDQ